MEQVKLSEEKDQQTILLFLPKYIHTGGTEKKAFANAPVGTPITVLSFTKERQWNTKFTDYNLNRSTNYS